ncbi:MAG: hypothetical protein IKX75_04360 [Desulfovibrio sp.]|nr:hypothetical protein [Desulfovibrio sp.]
MMEAFAWLLRDEARRNAIFEGFYGIDRDLARRVGEAKDELDLKMHFGVLAEWALAEGPCADAARAGFARLVLRECPASFSREDLAWIRALEGSSLSLYEIQKVAGGRLLVQDLVHAGDPEWIDSGLDEMKAVPWEVVGLRLVPGRELRRMGTGMLEFDRQSGLKLARQIKERLRSNARRRSPEAPARLASSLCLQNWLYQKYGQHEESPLPELVVAGTDEEFCFVKDLYCVADWDALKRALALREDVAWEGAQAGPGEAERWSWNWLERGAMMGGMDRILAHLSRTPDGLLVECMAKGRADDARAMIEACAGGAAAFASRSVQSVQEALARRLKEGPSPEAELHSLPPEVASEAVRQVQERYYWQWMDMPVPALDGRTPRHAARLKTQKAKVVELLKTLEHEENMRAAAEGDEPLDFGFVWKELGLER